MAKKSKKISKKRLLKVITQYGIHIWAIFIIANAALVYAFHFSTHANTREQGVTSALLDSPSLSPSPSDAPSDAPSSPPQQPKGPTITLDFTIPGIGSGGGNLNPKRLKRNVTIYLYGLDENSLNKTVKPLYTVKGVAYFDNNKFSPTYTQYYTNPIDLGAAVKDGDYQISFRTDQSLRTLIKGSPDDISGKPISLAFGQQTLPIAVQTVLMGDTVPKDGDNAIDISDYNAFINCFGDRNTTSFCASNNYGDFNDDGVIDGIDYNILLLSFQSLLKQGLAIPQITLAPTGPERVSRLSHLTTPTPVQKQTKPKTTPTAAAAGNNSGSSGGNVLGGILFFFFLIILGATGFVLYKKNPAVRAKMQALLSMLPIKIPAPKGPETPDPTAAAADPNAPTEAAPPADPAATPDAATETPADPASIAASTEVPLDQLPATPAPETPPTETPPAAPVADTPAPPAANPDEAKDYYVKKKGPDDAGTGFWYTLTDDNGATEAHFTGAEVADGFAKVKGVMKTENGKTFLEASEIVAEG